LYTALLPYHSPKIFSRSYNVDISRTLITACGKSKHLAVLSSKSFSFSYFFVTINNCFETDFNTKVNAKKQLTMFRSFDDDFQVESQPLPGVQLVGAQFEKQRAMQ